MAIQTRQPALIPKSPTHKAQGDSWTHAEAIAYEVARECITDAIGVLSRELHGELYGAPNPPAERAVELRRIITIIEARRARLNVRDITELEHIAATYGAFVQRNITAQKPVDLATIPPT